MPRHSDPTSLEITGFGDAVRLALALDGALGAAIAAAACDHSGRALYAELAEVDASVSGGLGRSLALDDVLERVRACAIADPRVASVLLVSGGHRSVDIPCEDDLVVFRHLRRELSGLGVELVDWVQTDGRTVRSLDLTDGVGGWATS